MYISILSHYKAKLNVFLGKWRWFDLLCQIDASEETTKRGSRRPKLIVKLGQKFY